MNQQELIGQHYNVNADSVTYFDSSGIEHIAKEIKNLIDNENIITYIYRTKAFDLIIYLYVCTGFIDFMLKG